MLSLYIKTSVFLPFDWFLLGRVCVGRGTKVFFSVRSSLRHVFFSETLNVQNVLSTHEIFFLHNQKVPRVGNL